MGRSMTLNNVLLSLAGEHEKGITFIGDSGDTYLSYSQLVNEALIFLGWLQKRGLKPHDEMIFNIDNEKDFVIGFWGCLLGGITPVPVKVGTNDEEKAKLFKIWEILKKPYIYTTENVIEKMEKFAQKEGLTVILDSIKNRSFYSSEMPQYSESNEEMPKGEIYHANSLKTGFIQFSSGSTGDPKGVVLTHGNLYANCAGMVEGAHIKQHDSMLSWMPLTHDMGLIAFHLTPIVAGVSHIIMKTGIFVRYPTMWMKKTNQYRATILSSPNFGYKHFLDYVKDDEHNDWDLSCIRLIYNGAEPISYPLCLRFSEEMKEYKMAGNVIFPCYGLAEASVAVSFSKPGADIIVYYLNREKLGVADKVEELEAADVKAVSFVDVGYPLKGSPVRIVDDEGKHLADNTCGHIQIGGDNVMWGYYCNSEASKKAISEDGWVWTGDLGFLREGRVTITGRAKDVIFINGQNIYAHDIERVAEDCEGVELGKIAAVGVYNSERHEEEMIIFVRHKGKLEDFADIKLNVRKYVSLSTGLKVKHVIPVKKIPKTTSGKVQRYKLKEEYINGEFDKEIEKLREIIDNKAIVNTEDRPLTVTQKKLLHLWHDLLDNDSVGIHSDFFENGGDSLLAVILSAEIQKYFGIHITLSDIYDNRTVEVQAEFINLAHKKEFRSIEKALECDYYPMSSAQKRMYVTSKMDKTGIGYNNPLALIVKGTIDKRKLRKVIIKIMQRHEILRTAFVLENGEPVQKIMPVRNLKTALKDETVEMFLHEVAISEFVKPFEMENAPLMRAEVLRSGDNCSFIMFDMHHIITDGTSIGLFIKELNALYAGKELEPLRVQYRDFTMWQKDFYNTDEFKAQETYWLNKMSGDIPVLNLPADNIRPAEFDFKGKRIRRRIKESQTKALKELVSSYNTTLYTVLLSAYKILLYKYTGQNEIIVGTPVSGRNHADLRKMIGVFINTLAISTKINGEMKYSEYLSELQTATVEAFSNQDYPFEMLVDKLKVKRDLSRNPVFDTMFSLLNTDIPEVDTGEGTKFIEFDIDKTTSMFDISMEAVEKENNIVLNVDYCESLFERSTVERFIDHYLNILKDIAENSQKTIDEVNILDKYEVDMLLNKFNATKADYPKDKTIHQLFEEQAARTPDNVAVVFGDEKITYGELNEKANSLASHLRKNGINNEDICAVALERSFEMIIAVFGILKAGAGYLPIDPENPVERINYIIKDSNAKAIISIEKFLNTIKPEVLSVNLNDDSIYENDKDTKIYNVTPRNIAYVIYTSGSTGQPKGAVIEHGSVVNRINWMQKAYPISEKDIILQKTPYTFDVSVWELFWWSWYGASVYMLKPKGEKNPDDIIKALVEENISIMHFVPSMLGAFIEYSRNDSKINSIKNLRRVFASGEALLHGHVEEFEKVFRKNNKVDLVNLYGPTEATVDVSYFNCYEDKRSTIPIGKPIDNIQLYVLGKNNKLQPVNVAGELYIGGIGLARGYLNRPELTSEKFVDNPFKTGEKLYRTGDVVRCMPDGNIEFLGRTDFQVKIRGNRIEIGEIENKLSKIEGMKEVIVIAKKEESGVYYLIAYYSNDKKYEIEYLKGILKKELPDYMIPAYFVQMEEMPHNSSGKIDRKQLPEPQAELETGKITNYLLNEKEDEIAFVWQEILGVSKIGRDDNFFYIGGDSIKAIQTAVKLQNLGYEVSINDIFETNTLGEFAFKARKSMKSITESMDKIVKILNQPEIDMPEKELTEYQSKCSEDSKKIGVESEEYKRIMLTGATGFLGAYILREILTVTKSEIIVTVRAKDNTEAQKRIEESLKYYFGDEFINEHISRIIVICADLTVENLGMTDNDYEFVSRKAELIINTAAIVKHFGQRDEFVKANVDSVRNLIVLSNNINKKKICHISTTSVASGKGTGGLFSEYTIDAKQEIENLYVWSKHEAEKVLEKSFEKGTNGLIVRVGNLVGDSISGSFQKNIEQNAFYNHMKALIDIGFVPNIKAPMIELSFIDQTAKGVVILATRKDINKRVFNLYNNYSFGYDTLGNYLGLPVVEIKEYFDRIVKLYKKGVISAENIITRMLMVEHYTGFKLMNDLTNIVLEMNDFRWKKPDKNYVEKIIEHGRERGFFM